MDQNIKKGIIMWFAVAAGFSTLLLTITILLTRTSGVQTQPLIDIGVLISNDFRKPTVDGLQDGLEGLEIKNFSINLKNANGDLNRLSQLAQAMATENLDYILAIGGIELEAVSKIKTDIPVFFADVNLPERRGFNFPGIKNTYSERTSERLSIAKEIFPAVKEFFILTSSTNIAGLVSLEEAKKWEGKNLDHQITIIDVNTPEELDHFINNINKNKGVLFLTPPAIIQDRSGKIIQSAIKAGLPVVGFNEQMTFEGAIFSYGEDRYSMGFAAANLLANAIRNPLKDRKVDIRNVEPVLTVNLKTADKLGIEMGEKILIQAQTIVK